MWIVTNWTYRIILLLNGSKIYINFQSYIIHSYIIHHTSYIHISYIINHTWYIINHKSYTWYIIHHTSYILQHTSYIIHHTSHIIHHTSYIIHHTSYIIQRKIRKREKKNIIRKEVKENLNTITHHKLLLWRNSYIATSRMWKILIYKKFIKRAW